MLSLAIFLPLVAAAIICCIPGGRKQLIRFTALGGTVASFLVTVVVLWQYARPETEALDRTFERIEARILDRVEDPKDREALRALVERGDVRRDELRALEEAGLLDAFGEIQDLRSAGATPQAKHLKFTEYAEWIPVFHIRWFVAADGLSLPLIFLTALLGIICVVYSWNVGEDNPTTHGTRLTQGTKGYMALFMLLQTGLMGVFLALDFVLFYVFWEVVLLPMYFLIGIWGGPRRIYAAIKFFIYTVVGSVLMLLAILAMYFAAEPHSFNVLSLTERIPMIQASYPLLGMHVSFQALIFLALFIGFAIKVPVFPFHTWLPDAHVEAPTAVSVVLAGVLLKMGGYGFFRMLYPLAAGAALQTVFLYFVAILGVVNIIYGAFCAMAQKDFKSLVAYSSISHMGYVLLGLAAITFAGVEGAALQMFNHGVSSAMMFLLVGVLYERAHHRDLARFGGIGLKMPYYTGFAIVGFFAALGLPGLNGFISEVMVFLGAFNSPSFSRILVYVAVFGIILTAAYILWAVQRVYLVQPRDEKIKGFSDLSFREVFCLVPLAFLCILVGVWPKAILVFMDSSMSAILETIRAGSQYLVGG